MTSAKEYVSTSYLDLQKATHGEKLWQGPNKILITGDGREGSIGGHIRDTLSGHGSRVASFSGDIRTPQAILPGSDWDALICCHGVMDLNWFENADPEKAAEIIDVNLTGSYRIAQRFVKATIDQKNRKRIIFIGSMAYTKVLNGSAAYCASKAGLAMLTRCLAWELAPKGFDVYCVHPSNVEDAPMSEDTIQGLMRYRHMARQAAESYWATGVLRDHQLTKDEITFVIRTLLRSEAAYLSGSNIELAGGAR